MMCPCLRDDALDCTRERYGDDADEPCQCCCHEIDEDEMEAARDALADFYRNGGSTLDGVKSELDAAWEPYRPCSEVEGEAP